MNIKRVTSLAVLAILSCNVSFAELVPITDTGESIKSATTDTSNKLTIIENLTTNIDTSISLADSQLGFVGNYSTGVSNAFSYFTPDYKFGFMEVSNGITQPIQFRRDDMRPNASASNMWTFSGMQFAKNQYKNIEMMSRADAYFNTTPNITSDGVSLEVNNSFQKKLSSFTDTSGLRTEYADDGREFIANTLYVRYDYDGEIDSLIAGKNDDGPYFIKGDMFEGAKTRHFYRGHSDQAKNDKATKLRNDFAKNPEKYSIPRPNWYAELWNQGYWYFHCNATFFKRCEYRRYINENVVPDGKAEYEVAYPYEEIVRTENKGVPSSTPKISVNASPVADASNTKIDYYNVTLNAKALTPNEEYEKSSQEYILKNNTVTDSKLENNYQKEPKNNKMDAWHNVKGLKLYIKSPSGQTIYNKSLTLEEANKTIKIYTKDLPVGHQNLHKYTIELEMTYDNNVRFLSNREVYAYKYKLENGDILTFNSLKTYIKENGGKNTSSFLESVTNYHNSTNPRVIETYKTATDANNTVKAQNTIVAVINNTDPLKPVVNVHTNPPNALTVLEGGNFNVVINAKIPGKELVNQECEWVSNFEITRVLVTAQNGSSIYDSDVSGSKLPVINSSGVATTESIDAKPDQIGKATVEVFYKYDYNYKKLTVQPPEIEGDIPKEKWETTTSKGKGSANAYINIYSLTGITSS